LAFGVFNIVVFAKIILFPVAVVVDVVLVVVIVIVVVIDFVIFLNRIADFAENIMSHQFLPRPFGSMVTSRLSSMTKLSLKCPSKLLFSMLSSF